MATRTKKTPVLKCTSPATGQPQPDVTANTPEEVAQIVASARKVASEWAALAPEGRARYLKAVRHAIYDHLDDIVETVAAECGKPRAEALAHDVLPAVVTLQYMERMAPKWLKPDHPGRLIGPVLGLTSVVEHRPFGVVGCISPWNYPFFLSFMAIVPALLAGNTVVLKPSEVTPGVGERIREVLDPLPSGVAHVVQGAGKVGGAMVDAPCDKICFIGSPGTGRKIAAAAAKHLTPVVMELGGQDAAIVCDDADLDVATSGVMWGAFLNAGQACTAVERAYVSDAVADEFEMQLAAKLSRLRHDEGGDIGSLTTPGQLEIARRHLQDAIDKGAKVVAGGLDSGKANQDGTLWAFPTVIEGRSEDMDIYREETFGPLLPIIRVADDDEAVRRVNEEGFNLTASVWSTNRSRARSVASRLRAGTVTVNTHAEAAGAPWSPWGGVGESGYGRLNGIYGIREMTVPTHVGTNALPKLKRFVWYPYGDGTNTALRALSELLTAPSSKQKLDALKRAAGSIGNAIREKI